VNGTIREALLKELGVNKY